MKLLTNFQEHKSIMCEGNITLQVSLKMLSLNDGSDNEYVTN